MLDGQRQHANWSHQRVFFFVFFSFCFVVGHRVVFACFEMFCWIWHRKKLAKLARERKYFCPFFLISVVVVVVAQERYMFRSFHFTNSSLDNGQSCARRRRQQQRRQPYKLFFCYAESWARRSIYYNTIALTTHQAASAAPITQQIPIAVCHRQQPKQREKFQSCFRIHTFFYFFCFVSFPLSLYVCVLCNFVWETCLVLCWHERAANNILLCACTFTINGEVIYVRKKTKKKHRNTYIHMLLM